MTSVGDTVKRRETQRGAEFWGLPSCVSWGKRQRKQANQISAAALPDVDKQVAASDDEERDVIERMLTP